MRRYRGYRDLAGSNQCPLGDAHNESLADCWLWVVRPTAISKMLCDFRNEPLLFQSDGGVGLIGKPSQNFVTIGCWSNEQ